MSSASAEGSAAAAAVVKRKRGTKRPLEFQDWLKFDNDVHPTQRTVLECSDTFASILSFLEPKELLRLQLVSKGVQHLLRSRNDCFPRTPSRAVIRTARMHKLFAKSGMVQHFHPFYTTKADSIRMPAQLRHLSAGAETCLLWLPPKLESLYLHHGVRYYPSHAPLPDSMKRIHFYLRCLCTSIAKLNFNEGLLELWLPDVLKHNVKLPQSLVMLHIGKASPDLGAMPKRLRWLSVPRCYHYESLKLARTIEHLELRRIYADIAWPATLRRLRWRFADYQPMILPVIPIPEVDEQIRMLPADLEELSIANASSFPSHVPRKLVQLSIHFNCTSIQHSKDFAQLGLMNNLLFLHLENYRAEMLKQLPPNIRVLVLGQPRDGKQYESLHPPDSLELLIVKHGNLAIVHNAPRVMSTSKVGKTKATTITFMRLANPGCTLKVKYEPNCCLQDNLFVKTCGFHIEHGTPSYI